LSPFSARSGAFFFASPKAFSGVGQDIASPAGGGGAIGSETDLSTASADLPPSLVLLRAVRSSADPDTVLPFFLLSGFLVSLFVSMFLVVLPVLTGPLLKFTGFGG
jgi:hypothetical protein